MQSAIAATAEGEIVLIADTIENVSIAQGKNITLDLNGKVLKGTGTESVVLFLYLYYELQMSIRKTTKRQEIVNIILVLY